MTVSSPLGRPILTDWQETVMPKMWRFVLYPIKEKVPAPSARAKQTTLQACSAYDLPSIEALVHYMHAAAGFLTKSTWLKAIKSWIFLMWLGLTYSNASKYCPQSVETIKGHMTQSRKGVRSTNPKAVSMPSPKTSEDDPETLFTSRTWSKHTVCETEEEVLPPTRTIDLHVWDSPIRKLYTNDCGKFTIRSRSGKIHHDCLPL